MRLRDTWEKRGWPRVVLAFAINLLFLAVMLTAFAPLWETNDDLLISKFFDGQMSRKTVYAPFINITLGALFKLLYSTLGDGFNWYSACQYLLLLCGFTAVTWVLLKRFRLFPALVLTAVLLGAFGTDCYQSMNFSKPAAVGTVGGMCLLLQALDPETGRFQKTPMLLGILLGLAGYVWRYEEFLVCGAITAGGCLPPLCGLWTANAGLDRKARRTLLLRALAPFVLLVLLAACLFGVDRLAWNLPEVRDYTRFDYSRSLLVDFGTTDYADLRDAYDELGIDEDFAYFIKNWSFYDTGKFTQESIEKLIEARSAHVARRTPGEVLGIFLNKCLLGFTLDRPFAGYAFLLALWLACGRRRARDWLGFGWLLAVFHAIYYFLILNDRYLANRVDVGLFLALAAMLCFLLDEKKLDGEKLLLTAVLALSLFVTWRANRPWCRFDSHNIIEDRSFDRAAVEKLLADEEHLYFVKVWSIDHQLYTPLETPPAGYYDRIVFLGGWSMHHPSIEALLSDWQIENPWRDLVGREDIRLIDRDVERSLRYLRRWYAPGAEAELIEPLSSETDLMIYRITG
ncbi:MAG: hypothetical protein K6F56_08035 [Oscillospiraceae bacterium]|nr:hypothetical protein [Oscillospiraceae bacterium]